MPHIVLTRLAAFFALLVCAAPALAQADEDTPPSRAVKACAGAQRCTVLDPFEAIPADDPAFAEERAQKAACNTGDAAACRAFGEKFVLGDAVFENFAVAAHWPTMPKLSTITTGLAWAASELRVCNGQMRPAKAKSPLVRHGR